MKVFKSYMITFFFSICAAFIYFFIDKLNIIKNHYNLVFDDCFLYVFLVFLIIISIFLFFYSGLYRGFSSKKINIIDYLLFFFLIFTIATFFSNLVCEHSVLINCIFGIIILILIIIRIMVMMKKPKQREKMATSNLYKIKELYENKIEKNCLVLLEEKEVEDKKDDILDLSYVKNNLKRFIMQCQPNRSFVLGLIGEWGIGKTSTIRLVENELHKESVSFDYFNPWMYDSNNELIEGFLDFIIHNLSSNYKNDYELTRILKKYKKMVIHIIDEKIGTNISSDISNDLKEEQKVIGDYISRSNIKHIIIVDNLDRINREQLHLVFNVINNILNFNGLIFILCYDEKVIRGILSKDLEYSINYMDKIVNSKIYMPLMDTSNIMDIGEKCISNLLKNSGILVKYRYEYNSVVAFILEHITNLRELSRFINTLSLNLDIVKERNLYINDFILLEYVKFFQNEFYKFIYNNINTFYNRELFKNLRKTKDSSYFTEDNLILLNFLFNGIVENDCPLKIYREQNDHLELRCNDSNVVSTYFSQKQTNILRLTNDVINLVEKINNTKIKYGDTSLFELCVAFQENIVFSLFENYLSLINNRTNLLKMVVPFKYNKFLKSIIDYIFISKSGRLIMQNIESLEKYNKSLFIMYADDFVINYSTYDFIKNGILEELERISESCLKNPTSIFKKEYYDERVFYVCLKYVDEEKINVRKYLNKIINEENVFRVIGSFITNSCSKINSYSYIIELDNINKYLDVNNINKILLSIDKNKKNMDQRRVMTIYKAGNNKKYKNPIDFSNL